MTGSSPSAVDADDATPRKRIGRPPRIDREAIARAVVEIGFDEVTMKKAADHIGVSVPGLYHYVKGRDDLIRLAAEYAVAAVDLPVYTSQTWQDWLREWGRYMDRSMSDRPEVFQHFLTASLDEVRVTHVLGAALERLVDAGLTTEQAYEAWQAVSAMALGTAAGRIRERSASAAGSWAQRTQEVLDGTDGDEMRTLREVVTSTRTSAEDVLERQLDIVIRGIESRLADDAD